MVGFPYRKDVSMSGETIPKSYGAELTHTMTRKD